MNHPSNSVLNLAIGAISRTMAALVAILFFLVSCSNAPGGAQKAPQSQGPGEQTNEQVQPVSGDASDDESKKISEEYGSLPRQVVIGVSVDGDGRDVAGSGEMRIPAQDVQVSDEIASDEAAHQAFESGQPAHVVADVDELDKDSSTQSWASPLQASDYGSYQPHAYSRWNAGGTYTYGEGRRFVFGSRAYYVYLRPVCPWLRCLPHNGPGAPGPGPGAPGPGPGAPGPGPGAPGPGSDLDATLRAALQAQQIAPMADNDWMSATNEQVELGARLFNDRLLSARGDIACATCHMDAMGTSDNLSVGITGDVISRRKVAPFGSAMRTSAAWHAAMS
ncbi:hypothetical protein E3A20_28980 [Planctomyces bekefii]|uniref:Di-haem cytochrome c peroxidase domain-containing protein n=1 Tax=Planctomyces bekefii TaxID=1653850 RepID=A0A5C6M1D5_9PLAN|nr:hypothetical protein E3A20_28980 [Planctomyces bekefii]